MTGRQREVFIDVRPDTRIRFCRSEAPPPISYAISLEIYEGGEWATVQLWDNADGVDEHHEHAHTRSEGKQPPMILEFSTVNDAMAAAIRKAKAEAQAIVRRWREEP